MICNALDTNRAVFMAMLDLSAAFDTVDHPILLRQLSSLFGIRDAELDWFASYLSDRSMQVLVEGVTSESVTLDCSVPQGSKHGPRLYSDYTYPFGLLFRILLLLYHFYADDSQLLRISSLSPPDQSSAVHHLERSFYTVSQWMHRNKLKLNPTKTEFIVISSKRNQSRIIANSLELDSSTIARSDTVRNLGITMDSTLEMHAQVSNLRKTCYYYIAWIREIRPFMSEHDAKALVHALVISRLDYCNSLYHGLPQSLLHDLQMVMNDAARVVKRLRRNPDISITSVLKELHWLPMSERSKFKIISLVHKCVYGTAPTYMSAMIVKLPEPHVS